MTPNGPGAVHRGVEVDTDSPKPGWAPACSPKTRVWAYKQGVARAAIKGRDCRKCFPGK